MGTEEVEGPVRDSQGFLLRAIAKTVEVTYPTSAMELRRIADALDAPTPPSEEACDLCGDTGIEPDYSPNPELLPCSLCAAPTPPTTWTTWTTWKTWRR